MARTVILTEVSNVNEVEGSRTASRLGVKPVPVSGVREAIHHRLKRI
jgi:hypothetical protein